MPEVWMAVKKKRGKCVFIVEGCYQVFEKVADIR
jgi:hypothetical protein